MMTEKCILVVDDDEPAVKLLQLAFEEEGVTCPVRTVTDGEMALEYLARKGPFAASQDYPLPCLVMLDLSMPRLSGLEVLEWIRRQPGLRRLVVVVFSSSGQDQDIDRAYELGANSYIEKPMGLAQTREIARLLKGWWLGYNRFARITPGLTEGNQENQAQNGTPIGRTRTWSARPAWAALSAPLEG